MLTATDKWKAAARAGTSRPVLQVEIKPTVLSAEVQRDWTGALYSPSNMDLNHPTRELRLKAADAVHPAKQEVSRKLPEVSYPFYWIEAYEEGNPDIVTDSYSDVGQYIQTLVSEKAGRLKELWVGIRPEKWGVEKGFRGKIRVRLFTHLKEKTYSHNTATLAAAPAGRDTRIKGLFENARMLIALEADCAEPIIEGASFQTLNGNHFLVFDLSKSNIYLPGGGTVCAIDFSISQSTGCEHVKLYGALIGPAEPGYTQGQLYWHCHVTGLSSEKDADVGFRFLMDGFESEGEAQYLLDLGRDPFAKLGLIGELELCYCEPAGTSVTFEIAEKSDGENLTPWRSGYDGSALINRRYVYVKATMKASGDQLQSPRLYSIRAAYKREEKFLLSPSSIDGHSHAVLDGPNYSAEGDPLKGVATFSDISTIELMDPSGMLSQGLFGLYNLKNDEIVIGLGFEGLDFSDFLPIKSLWIDNWQPAEGKVIINCYDKQARLKEAEIPTVHEETPSLTEEIHFGGSAPADIKKELLTRALIRPSRINTSSFNALNTAFPWSLNYVIEKPEEVHKICKALNQHLLSFEFIDEAGTWQTPYVDYEASPAATIESAEILRKSETYNPGWDNIKNVAVVLFSPYEQGSKDEKKYDSVVIDFDPESQESFKETNADKLFSGFIPLDDDPGAAADIGKQVAQRRLLLQKDGFREVSFDTRIHRAEIQIGDHIYLYSDLYSRPGVSNTNPLLCIITRKHIDSGLGRIKWFALVLKDSQQTIPGITEIDPPQNINVTDNGDGTVTWSWDKSAGDNGTDIVKYLLYLRKWNFNSWGGPWHEIEATGAASYTYEDSNFRESLTLDFGIRAVHKNGKVSPVVEKEKVTVTGSIPGPPTWEIIPIEGGWSFRITADVDGATAYIVYRYRGAENVHPVASIPAPAYTGKKRKAKCPGDVNVYSDLDYGIEWGWFAISAINAWGEGAKSAYQARVSRPKQGVILASSLEPTLPAEAGTYPILTPIEVSGGDYKFEVELKIAGPANYLDLVSRYEVQRRIKPSAEGAWGSWKDLPPFIISTDPAPAQVIWTNTDAIFKPGSFGRWRARAVGIDGDRSAWTTALEKEIANDTTPPDKPTLTVTALPVGILVKISEPAEDSGACNDFSHFKVEGKEAAGAWGVLDEHCAVTWFLHDLADASMGGSWQYRVTAYDRSLNPSTVSDESGSYSVEKVSTNALSTGVNTTLSQVSTNQGNITSNSTSISQNAGAIVLRALQTSLDTTNGNVTTNAAAITVNASNINLRVSKNDVINQINISTEEIRISGVNLNIDANTTFAADVEIQGILKSTGGIKTSAAGNDRITIGAFGGDEAIRFYSGGNAAGSIVVTTVGAQSGVRMQMQTPGNITLVDFDSEVLTFYRNVAGYPVSQRAQLAVAAGDVTLDLRSGDGTANRFCLFNKTALDLQDGCVLQIGSTTVLSGQMAVVAVGGVINAPFHPATQWADEPAKLVDVEDLRDAHNILQDDVVDLRDALITANLMAAA